jgi:tetratricopeptide (TPR) repeat protein
MALQACVRGRQYYPLDAELLFREAQLRRQARDFPAAAACLERLLNEPEDEHFASVDSELRGSRARDLLGHIYLDMKNFEKAKEQWDFILRNNPDDLAGHLGLAELLLEQKDWNQFDQNLQGIQQLTNDEQTVSLLQARELLAQQRFEETRALLLPMIERFPHALPWRVLLSHAYLQEGKDWQAAEASLRQILSLDPDHAEARNNLKILLRDNPPGSDQ